MEEKNFHGLKCSAFNIATPHRRSEKEFVQIKSALKMIR
jgi:hypothetical protein